MKRSSFFYNWILWSIVMLLLVRVAKGQYTLTHQRSFPADMTWAWSYAPVAADLQGNQIHSGSFLASVSFGPHHLTNTGAYGTSYIAKQDGGSMAWLWAKKITPVTSSSVAVISNIVTDNSGNIYITGSYLGSVSFDNITLQAFNSGQYSTYEFFVAKMNSSGNFLWAKREGSGTGDDFGNAVAVDGTGNVYVAGSIAKKKMNCKICFPAEYLTDIYVVKYNASGSKQWEKKYTNSNNNLWIWRNLQGNDITIDGSGNSYITGDFWGTVSFGNGAALSVSTTNPDVFVAKLNASGSTQWVRRAGGSGDDESVTIAVDASGNVYTGGTCSGTNNSFGTITIPAGGYIARYSATGAVAWAASTGLSTVKSLFINNSSQLTLIDDLTIKEVSAGTGAVLSSASTSFTGNSFLNFRDAAKTGSGYILSAIGCGNGSLDNLALASAYPCSSNYLDLFIIKQTPASFRNVTIDGSPSTDNVMILYPNPAKSHLSIKSTTGLKQIRIVNAMGSVVLETSAFGKEITLDISHLPPGIYCLNGGYETKSFLKE